MGNHTAKYFTCKHDALYFLIAMHSWFKVFFISFKLSLMDKVTQRHLRCKNKSNYLIIFWIHCATALDTVEQPIRGHSNNLATTNTLASGFSNAGAFFFALRSRLSRAMCLRFRPRLKRRRTRQLNNGISCSLNIKHKNMNVNQCKEDIYPAYIKEMKQVRLTNITLC